MDQWIRRGAAAELLGISTGTFDIKFRKQFETTDTRKVGAAIEYRCSAVARLCDARRASRARTSGDDDEDALLTSGVASPELERYRKWRADREQLTVERMRADTITASEAREFFNRLAATIRQAGEELGRSFGAEAQRVLNDALAELSREYAGLAAGTG